jgi:2-haloacid dehalogenase
MNFGINYFYININAYESQPGDATITYHLNSVAQLPACIGYEHEYTLFLNQADV